jgi:predicted flap endonuclease-1-like 5' DNA nuclease
MGLLDAIKSALGIGKTTTKQAGETSVAVEREPDNEAEEVEEPVAEPTDAAGSTESLVDEEAATSDATEAAEPAEAAGPEPEDVTTDIEETDPEGAAPAEEETTVQEIKGIGPAYGERLIEAGVVAVSDLVDADPERLTEQTGISDSRIREWIDRAREFEE